MDDEILSGKVCGYSNGGKPVVKSDNRLNLISGYTTAHKTPIGDDASFVVTESRSNMNIAKIVNEIPSNIIGTISALGRTGQSIMDCNGKIILLSGYIVPPEVGTDIEYRTLFKGKTFDTAWFVDNNDAVGKTLEFMAYRSDVLTFVSSREKDFFLDKLKDIGDNYSRGYVELSLMSIEDLYFTMDKRLVGKNRHEADRFDILNGLKFIKMMIKEKYLLRA